jgi:hypothetical protein
MDSTKPDLAKKIEEAFAKLAPRLRRDPSSSGVLLLLLDAEKDCPKDVAPSLLHAAKAARSDVDIVCVLAKQMLENWIMAGASTLAGVNDLPDPLPDRDQFEVYRFQLRQGCRGAPVGSRTELFRGSTMLSKLRHHEETPGRHDRRRDVLGQKRIAWGGIIGNCVSLLEVTVTPYFGSLFRLTAGAGKPDSP